MKVHIISFVPAQILCLGEFWFSSYKPKCLNQSDCRILISAISHKEIDEFTSFLACRQRFTKSKRWFLNFMLGMVKNAFNQITGQSAISATRIDE